MAPHVHPVKGSEAAAHIASGAAVVVDCFATWCAPCKTLLPVLEKIASIQKNVKFLKVDIDESPDFASKFSVSSVPTLLFFKGGELVDRVVGTSVPSIDAALKKLK